MARRHGFSLVEVLVGLVVLLVGLLPAAAALAVAERVGWQGRTRADLAVQLLVLADSLRAGAGGGLPDCPVLTSGSFNPWPDGLLQWTVAPGDSGLRHVVAIAERRRAGLVVSDTAVLRVRCR